LHPFGALVPPCTSVMQHSFLIQPMFDEVVNVLAMNFEWNLREFAFG